MSRIIAGSAGGVRLITPRHSRTRPTTDRVREALFSSIAAWAGTAGQPAERQCAGLRFLDLYAGIGGVGLEAASRGASRVVLVEHDPATAALIRRNLTATRLQATVIPLDAQVYLGSSPAEEFDVIFADPPYALDDFRLTVVLAAVVDRGWLALDGLLVVERASRDPQPRWPSGIGPPQERRYGETVLYYCQAATRPAQSDDQE